MTKWLLALSVLLNIGLFAYFNQSILLAPPEIKLPEIKPEKLKLLSTKELGELPKREQAAVALAPANACYVWGRFVESNLPAAQVVLAGLSLPSTLKEEQLNTQENRYWVYYPPLKSTAEAQIKANEIKALGVTELYIIQDSQWRNAISFGLFQDDQLATNLLNDLRAKGVKSATKSIRGTGKNAYSLLLDNVDNASFEKLKAITPEFVGTSIEPRECSLPQVQ